MHFTASLKEQQVKTIVKGSFSDPQLSNNSEAANDLLACLYGIILLTSFVQFREEHIKIYWHERRKKIFTMEMIFFNRQYIDMKILVMIQKFLKRKNTCSLLFSSAIAEGIQDTFKEMGYQLNNDRKERDGNKDLIYDEEIFFK